MRRHFYFLLIALLCDELLVLIWINVHRTSPFSQLEFPTGLKAKIERVSKKTALEKTMPQPRSMKH